MTTGHSHPAPTSATPTAKPATTKSASAQRMDWPDIAKGVSILGVVLLHVTLAIPGANETLLAQLNLLLDPLRMPLFFLVSGFFSVKVLNQTFGELFRGRLWFYLIPYLIWTPINLYTYRLEGTIFTGRAPAELEWYAQTMALATNMYWFLYFLILFNVILWATKKLPGWAIVAVVAAPWLFMPAYSEYELLRKTIIYLPLFMIGAYFRPLITRFAEAATKPAAIVFAVVLYVAGLAVNVVADAIRVAENRGATMVWLIHLRDQFADALGGQLTGFDMNHIPSLIIRILSIPAGIVLCVWLSKLGPIASFLKMVGRHTLPIYIGHALGLTLIFGFSLRWRFMKIDNAAESMWYHTNTWMVIAFACAMLGGYLMYLLSKIPVLGWTMVPPRLPESKVVSGGPSDAETTDARIAEAKGLPEPEATSPR
ncbi:hypothetical protein CDES_09900 [Corynebacterium deserti GIMN1.010]|uniref:Acyltransferase 3 domain-containing protein n=1 Tax=Corynebacterium deserti GIMN1.010 TaxID=931089 RepID=A0A0M4CH02_9CORY|nr:acyltransferase family protein [Corynebacterium deserti]ALC06365.1 hypothetical protein CDES_09900 [Corynebacterium deserti GIMN1.010]